MSSPNPLVPQGSLLEQQAKSKSTFHVAALIVGIHVCLLGGLLILGCKREEAPKTDAPAFTDTLSAPPPVTSDVLTNYVPPVEAYTPDPAVADPNPPATAYQVPAVPAYAPLTTPAYQAPATTAAPAATEYVIKKGDIAYNLATKNGLSLKQLQDANSGVNLARLAVGQKIQIPAAPPKSMSGSVAAADGGDGSVYVVKGGDNLTRIAKKYGTTIKAIRDANGLPSNDIKIGQKLKIPAKAAAASASPSTSTYVPPVNLPTAVPSPVPQ